MVDSLLLSRIRTATLRKELKAPCSILVTSLSTIVKLVTEERLELLNMVLLIGPIPLPTLNKRCFTLEGYNEAEKQSVLKVTSFTVEELPGLQQGPKNSKNGFHVEHCRQNFHW